MFQNEDLVAWFAVITEKDRSDVKILADCYTSTTVKIPTFFRFISRMSSLNSLELPEFGHQFFTAISVEKR